MIPDYLVNILVYFLTVTSKYRSPLSDSLPCTRVENYKVARHLTKYRRFALDTNHLEQQRESGTQVSSAGSGAPASQLGLAQTAVDSQISSSSSHAGQSSKQGSRKCNKTYIAAIKNFS